MSSRGPFSKLFHGDAGNLGLSSVNLTSKSHPFPAADFEVACLGMYVGIRLGEVALSHRILYVFLYSADIAHVLAVRNKRAGKVVRLARPTKRQVTSDLICPRLPV